MKTLYSSTFLSLILAFLALLGQSGTPVMIVQDGPTPAFQTIIEPIGPTLPRNTLGKVKVEVFNSFDCKSCDLFGQNALPDLVKKYTGSSDVELHLYLIPDKTKESELFATRGALCATKYDRFWDTVYKLHQTEGLSSREVDLVGQELGFPVKEFRDCIGSEEFDGKIDEDIAYGTSRNIGQKPTILVNDTILLGAQPIENIERIINKYLSN
jgi:protein-disulfide isomerase